MKALAKRLTLRQLAIAIGLAAPAVVAFGLGWLQDNDIRGGATRAPAAAAEWTPPQPVAQDLAADAKLLSVKQPFGAPAVPAVPQPGGASDPAAGASAGNAAVHWRIGGIVMTDTTRRLVVLLRQAPQNTERTELRNVGETLPDGSVVRSVDASSVTIDRQGMIVTVRMFAQN
jgi:hypothetical protein